MWNIENQLARAEAIIEALIIENRLLKARIALLEKTEASQQDFVSNVKRDGGYTEDLVSIPKSWDGLAELLKSNVKSCDGLSEDFVSNIKKNDGYTENSVSTGKTSDGYSLLWKANVKKEDGSTEHFVSNIKNEDGSPIDFSDHQKVKQLLQNLMAANLKNSTDNKSSGSELPRFIDPVFYPSVMNELREAGLVRVSIRFFECVAKLIIHFHNGSPSDYPSLMKLTGLSRGGLTKNMMSMRKRGMMVKTGLQQYGITEWSKTLLKNMVRKVG